MAVTYRLVQHMRPGVRSHIVPLRVSPPHRESMQLSVPAETAPREKRVAIAPDSIGRFRKLGVDIVVQKDAGLAAGFRDDAYVAAGARIAPDAASTFAGATIIAKVQPPTRAEVALFPEGATLISLMRPGMSGDLASVLAARKVTGLALELVPRITRAQSMDVLSSQATVVGYKAVLIGAERLPKFLPMLTTAAGNITPAKAFVLGAGVAGLQAIATARRLGAVVSAFDVRPAVREQVQSLGATFVAADLASAAAETAGGYAKEQSSDEQARTLAAIGNHIKDVDLVVTTAQIPGKAAPRLITADMVRTMRAGSVIVDVAAETGGNCELSKPGDTIVAHDVTIIAPLNLPSTVPFHASQMFGRNIFELIKPHIKEGTFTLNPNDEILGKMILSS
jgi:proton-translocating NAD(P)+ transhydrogenase subunit alpha